MKVVGKTEAPSVVVKEEPVPGDAPMSDKESAQTDPKEETDEAMEDAKVLTPKPEIEPKEEEPKTEKNPEASEAKKRKSPSEDETTEGAGAEETPEAEEAAETAETEEVKKPKKRKQKKEKSEKKKRKLNHQCASVKICHKIMSQFRDSLEEEDKQYLAKFSQLNRGNQGVMFANMCRTLRFHLKEKYPNLEKFEDIDMSDDGRNEYQEKVEFLIKDYIKESKDKAKEEASAVPEDAKESVPESDAKRGEETEKA